MDRINEIHQATSSELPLIADFLNSAIFIHRHLDWHNTLDWLDESPFLVLTNDNNINALLVAVPDPPGAAWIRCFAVGRGVSPSAAWEMLSPYAKSALETDNAKMIAVGLQEWFSRLLIHHNFSVHQKIIVLEWDRHPFPPTILPAEFTIRPMQITDLDAVGEVDRLSFESLWVNTPFSLQAAFSQCSYSTVVENHHQIIGYEMSTSAQFNAHLARLAVLPDFRHLHLGRALVCDMLDYFTAKGIAQFTVNTQNDNHASLHLYKSLGFTPTFEEYPVLMENSI